MASERKLRKMKRKYMLTAAFLAVTLGSVSCGSAYYVDSGAYKNFDVAADAGVEFPAEAFDFGQRMDGLLVVDFAQL